MGPPRVRAGASLAQRGGVLHRRLALAALCALTLLPSWLRPVVARPRPHAACTPEGRGLLPRHWVGCATDDGPRRDLTGHERLLLGLPLDVNTASAEDLSEVPGLSARLAAELVAERRRAGRFAATDELIRVRGIGPARLARARPHLTTGE